MLGGDQQERYGQMGYQIVGDGAVEFYYVAFRTKKQTRQREHYYRSVSLVKQTPRSLPDDPEHA